ncbi:phosphate ABC transporter permease PstA [Liquorilactobacillus ghanensis]|uniref:phosphate ABC transporter permease PstA n=1 Tax=Liquorilactobacillus ghanensis TaxID=399370 RepID=UPI0039E8C61E
MIKPRLNITVNLEKIIKAWVYLMAACVLALIVGLLLLVFGWGLPQLNWHFLTGSSNYLTGGGVGIQLFNTLYILVLTLVISLPLALGTAIWLFQYARQNWFTKLIRIMLEILSSLPTIVIGLVGFLVFVVKFHFGFSLLSGSLTLMILNLPLLTSTSENALRSADPRLRRAGLALGMSNWDCICKIIIPQVRPALLTGVVLSAGRIIGETAAVIYTAGQSAAMLDWKNWNPLDTASPLSPFRPAETLAVHIWKINAEGTIPQTLQISTGAAVLLILLIILFDLAIYGWLWLQQRTTN